MKKLLFEDKSFYKKLLTIAFPIAMQNLISSSLNMVDNLMIGSMGGSPLAAVGFANQLYFLFNLFVFGASSGCAIFIAQFWGKKDIKNIRKTLGMMISLGVIVSFLFTACAMLFPEFVMERFSRDPEVINYGVQYLRIIGLSYTVTSVSFSFGFSCRSIGEAKVPMYVSAIALGINTILNYALIFGNFGAPAMGVQGAAIATVIARCVELVLMLVFVYGRRNALAGNFKELFTFDKTFFKKIMKTASPVIVNEVFWSLGITLYMVAYGKVGGTPQECTQAAAAVQISNTIQNMFTVVNFGLGNACAVMIGNKLGSNKKAEADRDAQRFAIIGPLCGLIVGIILIAFAPLILSFTSLEPLAIENARRILIIMGVLMPIKTFNILMIVGILRSGGDTYYGLFMELGSVWGVGVPMAFLGALTFGLPIYLVFALVNIEEIFKFIVGVPRLLSKKWIRNLVDDIAIEA